jgi:predicted TIM-barrel fold metal-dependent hydrolase
MRMLVDIHTLAFPPEVIAQRLDFIERDSAFRSVYEDPATPIASADGVLSAMEDAGVDHAVVAGSSWKDPALCRMHSDYLLEAAASSGGRLIPFCTVHPAADGARKEMERLAARGARGLGEVRSGLQGYSLIDSEEADLLAWGAAAFDLIIMFHSTASPAEAGRHPIVQQLARFCSDFPGVNVIAGQLGGQLPFYTLMPEVRDALETTFVDTAGARAVYREDAIVRVQDLIGQAKVLFGSGYPLASVRDEVQYLKSRGLDIEAEESILGRNAARLLRL